MKNILDSWKSFENKIIEQEKQSGETELIKVNFIFILIKGRVGVTEFENDIRALPTVTVFSVNKTETDPQFIKMEATVKINPKFIGRSDPKTYIKGKLIPQISKLYYRPRILRWNLE